MATQAPLADVQALADWLGEPITDAEDAARAGSVLAASSVLVRQFTGKSWLVDAAIDPDLPDDVLMVTIQVAARGYTNPEGFRDERVDDWGGSGRPISEVGLFLTATEKAILAAHRPVKAAGIGIVGTTRLPAQTATDGWVPTEDGPLFPWY